ncbi:MAG: Lrp/AsnC family transcriptional regulator [Cyanobacteria bacterium P01_G01_bin.54]
MHLDPTDWQILTALQADARQSFTALGQQVGLSAPAVTERVRKLEATGIIKGYSARLNLTALGASIQAYVQLTTPPQNYPQVHRLVSQTPELLECHHLTGEASFLIRAVAQSLPHLEQLLQKLSAYGPTQTALVLSTPVPTKPIMPGIMASEISGL